MFLSVRNLARDLGLHQTHSHSSTSGSEESRTPKAAPHVLALLFTGGFLISAHLLGKTLETRFCGPLFTQCLSSSLRRNYLMKRLLLSCILLGLVVLTTRGALGQAASATTLVGTVTDSSGAAVPNATVVAVQKATGVSYKGQTTAAGDYSLPYVDVGTYSITVEAPGFKKFTRTEIVVQINQTVRTDFNLILGQVTNEITVSSAAPPIATDDAAIMQTVETDAISSLPIAGHDTLKLALTTAGVIQSGDVTVGDPPGESFAGPGHRGEQNDVSLDGVTILNTIHRLSTFLRRRMPSRK